MIKTILFDLDETILDFKKAESIALSNTLKIMGVEPTKEAVTLYSSINKKYWEMLEEDKVTRLQVLVGRFEEFFEKMGVKCEAVKAKQLYEEQLGIGHYFLPDAKEVLQELSEKYDLYLVSNGTYSVQESRIASAGIAPLFKDIFISEKVGYNKPSVEYFDYCFERIPGFCKDTTIIVGDSLTSDMRGGNNAGIQTCWFNPDHKQCIEDVHIDHEIYALKELSELMKKI